MRFRLNPPGIREVETSAGVSAFLLAIAKRGAADIEAAAPGLVKRNSNIRAEAGRGVATIVVQSPYWHFGEYGTANMGPRPYIRPTVQRLLSQHGGRFASE